MVSRGKLALLALAACAHRAPAPSTIDLSADFLARACGEPAGEAFARAWLEHDTRNARVYGQIYGREGLAEAAAEHGPRRDDICKQVRAFALAAPFLVDGLRATVTRIVGAPPRADVYVTVPVAGSDGRTVEVDGRTVVALNASAETFGRLGGTVVTVTHELMHDAQKARWGAELARLSPMAAKLYLEGGAVFAMTRLFPEVGERATGLSPDRVAAIDRARAAADLLAALDGDDDGRWFSGGANKLGYVIGLDVHRELARRHGPEAAVQLPPSVFVTEARAILADLARSP